MEETSKNNNKMNREIKFRVFNPQEKQMTNFRLCDYIGFKGIVYDRVGCNNSDNIWMQFTGLKDKNGTGNDVYEGDYFEAIYSDCPNRYSIMGRETKVLKIKATVVFKHGMFAVEMMHPQYKELVTSPLFEFLKNEQKVVLGNIYENAVSGSALPDGWIDWNELSIDQMVEHLRQKFRFSSSGDAKCIHYLLEFYDKHK